MLSELVIRDLALIEHVELSFGPGLNVITGETGAGKSLLVGALELLLGARPKPGMLRSGTSKATVEARFAVRGHQGAASVSRWARKFAPEWLDAWRAQQGEEERELILGRALQADGKTRAYVNGRPVTREALADLAPRLFEIHGQNDHQKLHDAAEQLRLLDLFGRLEKQVADYRAAREVWHKLVDEALRIERESAQRRQRIDVARAQLDELVAAAPEPDERTRLEPERALLRHATGMQQGLAEALAGLADGDDAALDRMRRAQRFLDVWRARVATLEEPCSELEAAQVHLADAVRALRTLGDRLEFDPDRLEQVEERLAELERLERKHKTDAAGLLARRKELADELERLERDESSAASLSTKIMGARALVLERGSELRRARKAQREKLVAGVQTTLGELGLAHARFDAKIGQRSEDDGISAPDPIDPAAIEADRARFGERGIDRIEFLLSANPGEELQRLRDVASGGETARIMLALRSALAHADQGRTLLFDEIDSGVGGRLGPAVGAHLRKLATHHQVLCVTHLPAIAAQAARHLRVHKSVAGGRTSTAVEELSGDARVREIADMIAGGADHDSALAEARRLLGGRR